MNEGPLPEPVGGAIRGRGQYVNRNVEAAWAAVYIFYLLWLVILFLSPLWERMPYGRTGSSPGAVGGGVVGGVPGMTATTSAEGPGISEGVKPRDESVYETGTDVVVDRSAMAGGGGGGDVGIPAGGGIEGGGATGGTGTGVPGLGGVEGEGTWEGRLLNLHRAVRDSFLILFAATVITMAGYGMVGESLGLIWAAFGALLVWSAVQLLPFDFSWWLDVLWAFAVAVLTIIVFAFAFRNVPTSKGA
ncbi:hypothetical protein HDU96_009221 [Phlyctochytrium bullatum]|nr:hypothetical protein HDU96_009221 [Phlyctochytrium bullatum]